MSDNMFLLGIVGAAIFGIILFAIMGTRMDQRRDLFLSYCTAHGDKYEVCAKAWEEGEMER